MLQKGWINDHYYYYYYDDNDYYYYYYYLLTGMQNSKLGMWKEYYLAIEGIQKGHLFWEKMVL